METSEIHIWVQVQLLLLHLPTIDNDNISVSSPSSLLVWWFEVVQKMTDLDKTWFFYRIFIERAKQIWSCSFVGGWNSEYLWGRTKTNKLIIKCIAPTLLSMVGSIYDRFNSFTEATPMNQCSPTPDLPVWLYFTAGLIVQETIYNCKMEKIWDHCIIVFRNNLMGLVTNPRRILITPISDWNAFMWAPLRRMQ